MIINVIVAEKRARAEEHVPLVCGNSDYIIDFTFDAEWDKYQTKTARFIFDDRSYIDVVFNGTQCQVPVLKNTHDVIVGVYAGDLKTTTPAYLHAQRSILCGEGAPADPDPDVYAQIMELLNKGGVTPETVEKVVEQYLEENPVQFDETDPTVPNWAKQPTKPSYTAEEVGAQPVGDYALKSDIPDIPDVPVLSVNGQTGDVTLKASDVGALPANTPIPESLPNPYPLVINGVSYDGSERVEIKEGEFELIETITIEEATSAVNITKDNAGKSFELNATTVKISKPANATAYILQCYTYHTNFYSNQMRIVLDFNNSGAMGARFEVYEHYGYYTGTGYMPSTTYSNSGHAIAVANSNLASIPSSAKICRLYFLAYGNNTIPAGSTIEIWGVRA